eukprot:5225662-Heterocapsa_arctica.AAC.1
MENGTPKGLLKDVKMVMGFAYFANAGEKDCCNTYGGNAMPATQSQTITGVITKEYTALPETEHMKAEDICLDCTEKADK